LVTGFGFLIVIFAVLVASDVCVPTPSVFAFSLAPIHIGSSYTKANVPAYQELQINKEDPWDSPQCIYADFRGIFQDVDELW